MVKQVAQMIGEEMATNTSPGSKTCTSYRKKVTSLYILIYYVLVADYILFMLHVYLYI